MSELTHVELTWVKRRIENWIRFGRIAGWPKVEKVLQAIDGVETLGIHPADAAPEHWRHIHNRLFVGERPRPYTHRRHQAWLRRRKLYS